MKDMDPTPHLSVWASFHFHFHFQATMCHAGPLCLSKCNGVTITPATRRFDTGHVEICQMQGPLAGFQRKPILPYSIDSQRAPKIQPNIARGRERRVLPILDQLDRQSLRASPEFGHPSEGVRSNSLELWAAAVAPPAARALVVLPRTLVTCCTLHPPGGYFFSQLN